MQAHLRFLFIECGSGTLLLKAFQKQLAIHHILGELLFRSARLRGKDVQRAYLPRFSLIKHRTDFLFGGN